VDERVLLVAEYVKGERTMTELCNEFGVSRKTACKWLARYRSDGPVALEAKSRAPHTHPKRVDPFGADRQFFARTPR
jgi:transposase-like protein